MPFGLMNRVIEDSLGGDFPRLFHEEGCREGADTKASTTWLPHALEKRGTKGERRRERERSLGEEWPAPTPLLRVGGAQWKSQQESLQACLCPGKACRELGSFMGMTKSV